MTEEAEMRAILEAMIYIAEAACVLTVVAVVLVGLGVGRGTRRR